MYLPILNASPQSFCTYLFSTYYTKCTLTFCLHFVFQTYFYVDISYKKSPQRAWCGAIRGLPIQFALSSRRRRTIMVLWLGVFCDTKILFFPHFSGVWWVTHKFYGYDIPIGCPHEQRDSHVIFVLLYSCVKSRKFIH